MKDSSGSFFKAALTSFLVVSGLLMMAKASKSDTNKSDANTKITNVGGRLYKVTKRDDGRFMVEHVGTNNAILFSYGDTNISCKGECDQILIDMQKFPKDLFS